jgi:hypothetical protein
MSDYKLTILRFQCPLTTVFPPYNLQGTEFQVTISTAFRSETRSVTGGALSSYIGDFLEFLLNPLINACHSATVPYITGADARRPPYVYYQLQEKLMHFVVPAEYQQSAHIFVNRGIYKFISGFPFQKIDEDNYMLRYYAPDNSILYSPPVQTTVNKYPKWQVAGEAINIPQEYPTDYRFNQLQSVIVTSNLPVRQETLPQSTQQNVFNPSNPLSYISILQFSPTSDLISTSSDYKTAASSSFLQVSFVGSTYCRMARWIVCPSISCGNRAIRRFVNLS